MYTVTNNTFTGIHLKILSFKNTKYTFGSCSHSFTSDYALIQALTFVMIPELPVLTTNLWITVSYWKVYELCLHISNEIQCALSL